MSLVSRSGISCSSSSCTSGSGVIVTALVTLLFIPVHCSSIIGGSSSSGVNSADSGLGSSGGGGGNFYSSSSNNNINNEVWLRNLDNQLLRLGSRLDQLMMRLDHLDSRVGRVQSQGHLRFDSIETSMQTTRQRLDLWSNQLNLIEEQLTRKWKNMESRFDSLVSSLDSKLDTKFNLVQRDNRRHNEFISSSFNSVIISQEKLGEKLVHRMAEVNTTLHHTSQSISNSTLRLQLSQSVTQNNTIQLLENFSKNLTRSCSSHHHNYRSMFDHHHHHASSPPMMSNNNNNSLITTKVSNMFDELVRKSQDLEAIVKDTYTMSNLTRREVQDGFRAIIPVVVANQLLPPTRATSSSNNPSSAEIMSGMIVESLSTVESMTSTLNRRLTELTRSMDERFDIVSMTLNGFMESCIRIQEKTPLIEERIAVVLDRMLDTIDNRTRNATNTWANVQQLFLRNKHHLCLLEQLPRSNTTIDQDGGSGGGGNLTPLNNNNDNNATSTDSSSSTTTTRSSSPDDDDDNNFDLKLDRIGELSEEEKKRFWESWLAPRTSSSSSGTSDVPEED